jgi:poly-gamma-glutamate synthesis protein (capsule biosynthesis protein)
MLAQQPAATPTEAPAQQAAVELPQGTALVTSPRLPLAGIGSSQIAALLLGGVKNWREVGAPIGLPVSTIALDGVVPSGMTPAATVADYPALLEALAKSPGAVAVVPLDQLDFQVNALKIDGVDPLRATGTDQAPIVRIGFAGDIIPGRNVGNYIRRYGDYTYPMLAVKDVLADFDATFANFECFISETIEPPELTNGSTLDFVTRPEFIPGLQLAGIDAVSMANNHAVYSNAGWGLPAFYDTIGFFEAAGMPYFGAGRDLDQARAPYVMDANGLSIAILGIDGITANTDYPDAAGVVGGVNVGATASEGGTNPLVMADITADIERLAGEHDIVIPFYHMSDQYLWTPRQWAIDVAHASIDAGATLVVSSHPHTIQGMEVYKGKLILYGIGNFVYDQMFSVDTRQGYVLDLTLRGNQVVGLRTHGVEIEAFSQPRFMSPGEQAALMDRFWTSTDLRAAGSQ